MYKNLTVINGDTQDYELTLGGLEGWDEDDNKWMIRIFTRNADEFGVLQFESSNPKSQVAVDKVKDILGDFLTQNTNCFVGIKDGYLVWKEW